MTAVRGSTSGAPFIADGQLSGSGSRPAAFSSGAFATGTPMSSASAGDPAETAGLLVLTSLHAMLKAGAMYSADHPQHVQLARRLATSLQPYFGYLGAEEIRVLFQGDAVVINDQPFRPDERVIEKSTFVVEAARACGLIEIALRPPLAEFDVLHLMRRFVAASRAEQDFGEVRTGSVIAVSARYSDEHTELLGHLEYLSRFGALCLYAELGAAVRSWLAELDAGMAPVRPQVRRAAARLIDAYRRDGSGLLGLTVCRPIPADRALHRLDAAIVALGICDALGFDDVATAELVSVALARPVRGAGAPWWERTPEDPLAAALLAITGATPIERVVTFEAGAPVAPTLDPSFYGTAVQVHAGTSILAVAEAYIDLLDPGASSNPFSPEIALQMMLAQAGAYFDPTIVSALVQSLGTWPPGTVVRLNSNDLAVVVGRPRVTSPLGRPRVRLLELTTGPVHDLSAPELGAYEIVGSTQRGACPINPAFVFLQ